jgi:hypothetical protein
MSDQLQPVEVPEEPVKLSWGYRNARGDEVRVLRCPACRRWTVDWPQVVRGRSCFDGHVSADFEVVKVLHGPAATAVWALFQTSQLATDGEWQGDIKALGVSPLDAIDQRVNAALEDVTDSRDKRIEELEGELEAIRRAVEVIEDWGADNGEKSEEEGDVPDERYKAFALAASFLRSKLEFGRAVAYNFAAGFAQDLAATQNPSTDTVPSGGGEGHRDLVFELNDLRSTLRLVESRLSSAEAERDSRLTKEAVADWLESNEAVTAVADRLAELQGRSIATTAKGQAIAATRVLGDRFAAFGDAQPSTGGGS